MNALKLIGRGDDLSADEEARFRAWLKQNPDSTKTDAELRQMWRAQQGATPAAANALQGPMPIAWGDPTNQPAPQQNSLDGLTPEFLAEIKRQMGHGGGGLAETEIPIPRWAERLGLNRPVTPDADPGMVVQPRRADVDSLYGNTGFVAPGDLRPLPANTPVSQLPSYQQGTDYVPEDGPAKLHEGEMVIPAKQADRIRAGDMPTVTVKPQRTLTQDEIEKRLRDQGYSSAGAKGIAQNFMRESGGDAGNVTGDHGTSRGLAQWHASRKDELEAFARDQKGSAADPEIQFKFLDKEMKEKFPQLRSQLMASDNTADAESKFRRIYERPASVMWSNDASGRPVLGNDRYGFSDYALGEHSGRRGTSLLYMDPQDYLDLSPPFDDDPKTSRSGRSLRASVGRGDAVESVPSLDMRVNGQTGTVTAQDGRNRALLAQEEGLDAIPVAVRQKGQGEPTEIAGMSGTILPNDFRKAEHVSRETSPDRSILGRAMDMIIPRAEAAEAKPGAASGDDEFWKQGAIPLQAQDGGGDEFWKQGAVPVAGGGQPSGDHRSVAERVGTGMVDPLVGVAQLTGNVVGGGMGMLPGALGRAGTSLQDFTNRKTAEREAGIQAERGGETGIDWWRLGGNVASPINLIPMGALGRAGGMLGRGLGGAAARGAVAGGVGALTQPVTGGDFLTNKAEQVAGGVVLGAATQAAAEPVARLVAKGVEKAVAIDYVKALDKATGTVADWLAGTKGPAVVKDKAVQAVLKRMQQDEKAGGPTAQDMLDLVNATPDKPLTLADVGGENTLQLAGRMARSPGEAREITAKALNDRDLAAGNRLVHDVDSGISGGSAYDAATALNKARATAAAPKYEAAFSRIKVTPEEAARVQRFVHDKIGQKALQKGLRVIELEKNAIDEKLDLQAFGVKRGEDGRFVLDGDFRNLRLMDAVKRGYDEIVEGFRDPTSGRLNLNQYGRAVNLNRAAYVAALRDMFPRYGGALDAWGGPSQSLDALKAGQGFLRQRPEEISRRIGSLSQSDKEFFKLGAADTLRDAIAKKGPEADEAKAILRSQYMRDQLRPLFDSDAAFGRFVDSVGAEGRMFGTRFNVLKGSHTAARVAEDASPMSDALQHGARAGLHAARGGYLSAGAHALRSMAALSRHGDPETNARIAKLLTSPLVPPPQGPASPGLKLLRDFAAMRSPSPPAQQANPRLNALTQMLQRSGPIPGLAGGVAGSNAFPDMQSITVRPEGVPQ